MFRFFKSNRLVKLQQVYGLLILLIIINGVLLYVKIFITQSFDWVDLIINFGALVAVSIGYFGGIAAAAIFGFLYIVWYTVWLTTYAPSPIWIDYVRIILIPTMCGMASYVRRLQIDVMIAYRRLKKAGAITLIDERVGIANLSAFEDDLGVQESIREQYPRYRYMVSILRIEFIDFIKDELGVEPFYDLINSLHIKYQNILSINEKMYWNGKDAFMFLLPYGAEERGKNLKRLLIEASLNTSTFEQLSIQVKYGMTNNIELKHIIQVKGVDGALYKLRQLTEEDIDGEYIR
ncbi:hypothetical protein [Culicoidibacter larvae]|uniref:Uncharacterized protein n=1 Tax=Culicoidibacter larvae TaxID=2579976 RepID=A0A5R8QEU2_9FIRM|nr:hypothetical protein [Culicoidibacter larvae]TLG75462.1 hypothetical protein FEZ08_05290 [Culicoidibacter larvae]